MGANFLKTIFLTSLLVVSSSVLSSERDQAKKLYSSLTGSTANKAKADHYEQLLKEGKLSEAAREIVESGDGFYNVTLKNFFTPMSNEDGSPFEDLNDMTATLIGVTRDDVYFFDVFYKNILYQIKAPRISSNGEEYYLPEYNIRVPKYMTTNNEMYKRAEEINFPLSDRKYFVRTYQETTNPKAYEAVAGIFSLRAWAAAYYIAGTNRAAFAYFAKNFLHLEMEQLSDTTIPDFRVRIDVDRSPGGDASTYKNFCVGCHAGQDALGGAFAYYDYVDGNMVYASHDTKDELGNAIVVGPVAPKYNRNNIYPDGKITTSDSWINLWTEGQNAYVGWGETTSGNGVQSLGRMLSETKLMRKALSEKAFKHVCYRDPDSEADKAAINAIATKFDLDGKMKDVFINAAIACMGE